MTHAHYRQTSYGRFLIQFIEDVAPIREQCLILLRERENRFVWAQCFALRRQSDMLRQNG